MPQLTILQTAVLYIIHDNIALQSASYWVGCDQPAVS